MVTQGYNIASALSEVAARQGDSVGLVSRKGAGYASWTFAELEQNSQGYCAALKEQGVSRGQRVMLMVKPSMEFVCLTFALFQLGAVVILIDPGMGFKNLLRCVGRVRPAVLVAIPLVQLFSRLFPQPFRTVRTRICVGRGFGILGRPLKKSSRARENRPEPFGAARDDLAAIIFTTGSTGPPKGVQYTHGIFHAQLELIRDYFGIGPGEIDQPGFPLFALFSIALGARAIIPDMNPAKPAQVNPERFIRSIVDQGVTYSFGSPAIWKVVSRYCLARNIILPVRKILMAGAPVPGELIDRVGRIMAPGGIIETPYGATESLPVASLTGDEILAETRHLTRQGRGTCVGRALPGIEIKIIEPVDGRLGSWPEVREMAVGTIGEIVVKGPVVTRAYDHNEEETRLAKIADSSGFWHRMGDMGYLDERGRLWFCGRKAHRVFAADEVLYTIPCEAVFNEHPAVRRSALVGVGEKGKQKPVLIVELDKGSKGGNRLLAELQELGAQNPLTVTIKTFLVHAAFPVDIRHNAKIFREKLALWAANQLREEEEG